MLEISNLGVGTHELRLVITDDNGATDSHEMDLIINANYEAEDKKINVWAILLIVVILLGTALITRRMRLSENESSSMPKWNKSTKNESFEDSDSNLPESELWNDSNASVGGKD